MIVYNGYGVFEFTCDNCGQQVERDVGHVTEAEALEALPAMLVDSSWYVHVDGDTAFHFCPECVDEIIDPEEDNDDRWSDSSRRDRSRG